MVVFVRSRSVLATATKNVAKINIVVNVIHFLQKLVTLCMLRPLVNDL